MTARRRLPSFAPVRRRDFRVVAFGNFVSQLGTWSQNIGIGWAAQQLTHSAFLVSLSYGVQFIPTLFLSPFGGLLADRLDRRRVTVIGNIGMAIPAAVLGVLMQTGHLTIWLLLGLAFVGGVMQTLTQPAMQGLVPHLVPPEEVAPAVAINSALNNVSRFVGGSLAGVIISAFGTAAAFYVNSVSFFAVVAAWFTIRISLPPAAPLADSFLSRLAGGIRYARNHRAVRDLLVLNTVVAMTLPQPLLSLLAARVLHGGSRTFGIFNSMIGVGSIVGALFAGRRMSGRAAQVSYGVAVVATGSLIVAIGLSRSVQLTMVVLAVFGVSLFIILTTAVSTIMVVTPDEFRGRVLALQSMSVAGLVPVNAIVAGFFASHFGIAHTIVLAGTVLVCYGIWFVATGRLAAVGARAAVEEVVA